VKALSLCPILTSLLRHAVLSATHSTAREVEWFDEATEAAELVRHLPVTGTGFICFIVGAYLAPIASLEMPWQHQPFMV